MADLKLLKKRSCMKGKLTIFGNYLKVLKGTDEPGSLQLVDLESRLSKFESLYSKFDALQCNIEELSDDPDKECEEREQFEDTYYTLVAEARVLLGARPRQHRDLQEAAVASNSDGQASSFKSNCVRLPKIELPVFHGDYQHWLEFRDTFISLIHSRTDIDNINKLHYLRASLKGCASLVIDNLDVTSKNYESAWKLICDRYDNKRLLVNNHVQALFKIDHIKTESCAAIRYLIDTTNKNLRALSALEQPTQHWDTLIIHIMSEKLDAVTHRQWEEHRNNLSDFPSLNNFIQFLSNRADLLETLQENKNNNNQSQTYKTNSYLQTTKLNQNNSKPNNNKKESKVDYNFKKQCPLCKQNHFLFNCESFRALPIETRIHKATEAKVCLNCLRPGHGETKCNLVPCKYCKKMHNTLLHKHESTSNPEPSAPINNFANSTDVNKQITTPPHVLLSTAMVKVLDSKGVVHQARLLLDNGSTANFVTQALCGKLGLSKWSASATVTGINNNTSYSTQSCSLTIMSLYDDSFKLTFDCHILPQLTNSLPSSFINIENIPLPLGIHLADPSFNIPSAIDILVGADVFWSVLCHNSINLGKNLPKLYETKLGWLVSGYVARLKAQPSSPVCNFLCQQSDPDLTRFWELDSIPAKHSLSYEERSCEQHFLENTSRNDDGRFVVKMPLKQDPSVLGDSYQKAKCRFISLEKKFAREPVFKDRYINFMDEYERLGHMTLNKEPAWNPFQNLNYFLPHHGVIREDSLTTKLRTVFDASDTTSTGISLNDLQMIGPTVQEDLTSILLRFRQHKYVVTGDIEKMYRAIELHVSQRSLQQILFRSDPSQPLQTYTLNTLTYGTSSAPYLATKCLVSLAPTAHDIDVQKSIERDFYVDDYLGGSSSKEKTIKICKGVISTLKSAQFNLRKFKSNDKTILKHISELTQNNDTKLEFADINKNISSKTLGLLWNCNEDTLSYSINIESDKKITKRHILSVISQIFDPLGLVSPCIVEAKLIMQKLWVDKYGWDDDVSSEIKELWSSFSTTLPLLNNLKIPRWVLNNSDNYEIHVFSDASERAYGVCLYVRSVHRSGQITVHLLTSKSKVAPIKPTTMPRLELCGALLASRLCSKVLAALSIPITNCTYWCDSTIVLGWLNTSPLQLKNFVRNRVNEIQESTTGYSWRYVPSGDNPADHVSRGLKADSICSSPLWWSGPSFLLKDESEWPKHPKNKDDKHDLPELVAFTAIVDNDSNVNPITDLIKRHSKLTYLQKSMAYLQRFIYNCKNRNNKLNGHLSVQELQNSLNSIVRSAQLEMFPSEYAILKSGKALPKKNRLLSLSPFIDENNIIRVGGRMQNSNYSYDTKHPILICAKHHFSEILFNYFHLKFLHAGPQLLLANIRQIYWPLGGKNLAKVTVHKCVRCCRFKANIIQPIMGQLPASRTELVYPFLHCCVDYAGPVLIADRKGRGCRLIKTFLAIFICSSTKACHIELVTALSSEAYLAALNRFISRRGKPQTITSDNGTNFVGTYNEFGARAAGIDVIADRPYRGSGTRLGTPPSPVLVALTNFCIFNSKGREIQHLVYSPLVLFHYLTNIR
ncbi:hypothetical protein ABMA28_003556 [Loxostege sticticalis]|uniref:Integrase catalytic domain-containing protein n=1 Tax=Loxostege sticticalis TaxID=481309 RepID=A0ABD0SWP3_LOXSC